jgi:hypothetical protein
MDESRCLLISVHGTWPNGFVRRKGQSRSRWDRANSPIIEHMTQVLAGRFADVRFHQFTWSGANRISDRAAASVLLRDLLTEWTNDGWQVMLVCHSHGGNVAADALRLAGLGEEATLLCLGTPFLTYVKVNNPISDGDALVLHRLLMMMTVAGNLGATYFWFGFQLFMLFLIIAIVVIAGTWRFWLPGEPISFHEFEYVQSQLQRTCGSENQFEICAARCLCIRHVGDEAEAPLMVGYMANSVQLLMHSIIRRLSGRLWALALGAAVLFLAPLIVSIVMLALGAVQAQTELAVHALVIATGLAATVLIAWPNLILLSKLACGFDGLAVSPRYQMIFSTVPEYFTNVALMTSPTAARFRHSLHSDAGIIATVVNWLEATARPPHRP